MDEDDEWGREPSAEDGYSGWFRHQQEQEAFGKRSPPVPSRAPLVLNHFMLPMATMMAEAMNIHGLRREADS